MALSDLELGYQYRPNQANLVDEFYIPCLSHSIVYQRAVGYFTSGSLAIAARGLSQFLENPNARMQLIASPLLEREDIQAIRLGYEAREDVFARALLRGIGDDPAHDVIKNRLGFLAWLISESRLEVKLAVVTDLDKYGIYHEKIGIFRDTNDNVVAFSGSSNETVGGLYSNFETIEVFCSWRPGDKVRVDNKCRDFDALWTNTTSGLDIYDFPEAVKERLLEFRDYVRPGQPDPDSTITGRAVAREKKQIRIPSETTLREYQKDAIRSWFQHNGSGILEMATGTGKTVTALSAAVKLYENLRRVGLIIVVPYTHLVEQWRENAESFGFRPILGYKSRELWETDLSGQLTAYNAGSINNYCLITTTTTFRSDTMQEIVRTRVAGPVVLIGDEVHHLGAPHLRDMLPENIQYRLGLSATPERWHDEDGTQALRAYFHPGTIFTFGLREAIQNGYLTRYEYHPHLVMLTDEENEEYHEISRQIARAIHSSGATELQENPRLERLLIERARLLTRAVNKLAKLRELMADQTTSTHNLFYCGDAMVNGERQIEHVLRLLGHGLGMRVHSFTAEEKSDQRRDLLERFAKTELQGLVAIRCLDEGVDVPATRRAYILASSTNPREWIQRRGRILRLHPGKDIAQIHDFIVIPRDVSEVRALEPRVFNSERRLIARELARVIEFAELAENTRQAVAALLPVKQNYNLLHL